MAQQEWWRINVTSRLIGERAGLAVVQTGQWFDVYIGRQHMTGTADIAVAFKILGF